MPELGIGQAQGMALATLSHCAFPTDVEASLRWFRDDIIHPSSRSKMAVCIHCAGLGYEVVEGKVKEYGVST